MSLKLRTSREKQREHVHIRVYFKTFNISFYVFGFWLKRYLIRNPREKIRESNRLLSDIKVKQSRASSVSIRNGVQWCCGCAYKLAIDSFNLGIRCGWPVLDSRRRRFRYRTRSVLCIEPKAAYRARVTKSRVPRDGRYIRSCVIIEYYI